MEANEAQELQEHAEHAEHEKTLRPVAFTMSVLAVLVAVTSVLGHRTHTDAVLAQNKESDSWGYFQAHKIRTHTDEQNNKMLGAVALADKDKAKEVVKDNLKEMDEWKKKLKEEQDQAEGFKAQVEKDEAKADHFDLAEALLEIGLVITSITLLTRRRWYWYMGVVFATGGIAAAVSVLFLK